jgi:hypothetical protein
MVPYLRHHSYGRERGPYEWQAAPRDSALRGRVASAQPDQSSANLMLIASEIRSSGP